MKCFNHIQADATGTCQTCGKGLCATCCRRFSTLMCEPCLLENNSAVAREKYKGLVITVVIFIAVLSAYGGLHDGHGHRISYAQAFLPSLFMAFMYWGWKFISNHFPHLTMGTGAVWVTYFIVKFVAATAIGIFVGPYEIFKIFKEIRAERDIRNQISQDES